MNMYIMKVPSDQHMHFAGTSSAEALKFYIFIVRKPQNKMI